MSTFTKDNKFYIDRFLTETKESIEELNSTHSILKPKYKKQMTKKQWKLLNKDTDSMMRELTSKYRFFDFDVNPNIPPLFERCFGFSLELNDDTRFGECNLNDFDIQILLQDKELYSFVRGIVFSIIFQHSVFKQMGLNPKDVYPEHDGFPYYFKDINSIVISYYFLKEENMTLKKLHRLMSIFFKGGTIDIINPSDRSSLLTEQMLTGIKYKKEKDRSSNNTSFGRVKSKKFDFLQYVSSRIVVKYITNQDYKHRFHKQPVEHDRTGFWRCYKDGKRVWVRSTIVNLGRVS